jgi:hypothetical protein
MPLHARHVKLFVNPFFISENLGKRTLLITIPSHVGSPMAENCPISEQLTLLHNRAAINKQ